MEEKPQSVRERLHNDLSACADKITVVRNDIYTVKYWQFALNFLLGLGAIALLIVSLFAKNDVLKIVSTVVGLALVVSTVVYIVVLKTVNPISYLQYTVFDKDKRYTFQVISKMRAAYSDGENTVSVDKGFVTYPAELRFPHLAFDFFKNMDVDMRIGKYDRDIYVGSLDVDGKPLKCKIVVKNGLPFSATVGGARVKYFDINNAKEKFVVPIYLRDAVEKCGLKLPKLSGLYVRDPRVKAPYEFEN